MNRLTLCLFFIVIFHIAILKVAQAEETTTDPLSKLSEDVEESTKPTVVEKVKVEDAVPVKLIPEVNTETPLKTEPLIEAVGNVPQTKSAKPVEGKDTKESTKYGNLEDRFFMPFEVLNSVPMKTTKVFFEFPKTVIGPGHVIGGQIGAAVAKTINTAKYIAGTPFDLLRSAVNTAYDSE